MNSVNSSLRTLIVVSANTPDAGLRDCLTAAGCDVIAAVAADAGLAARIAEHAPDLIAVAAVSRAGPLAAAISGACGGARKPLVVFTSDGSADSIDAAMAAGVAAYVVDGLEPERVKAVLGVAVSRFRQQEKLLDELSDARARLAERKVIDRAKGILMARYHLGEDEAYQRMRSMAMNKKLKMADLAQRVLDVDELLDK
jgi:response regulator NasT